MWRRAHRNWLNNFKVASNGLSVRLSSDHKPKIVRSNCIDYPYDKTLTVALGTVSADLKPLAMPLAVWRSWRHRGIGWLWARVPWQLPQAYCPVATHQYTDTLYGNLCLWHWVQTRQHPQGFYSFLQCLVSCLVCFYRCFVQLLNVFKKVPGFKEIRVLGFRWDKSKFLIRFSSVIDTLEKTDCAHRLLIIWWLLQQQVLRHLSWVNVHYL